MPDLTDMRLSEEQGARRYVTYKAFGYRAHASCGAISDLHFAFVISRDELVSTLL